MFQISASFLPFLFTLLFGRREFLENAGSGKDAGVRALADQRRRTAPGGVGGLGQRWSAALLL